jgi:hypothetical protein
MKLLFADESGDSKFKAYLGVCVACVDSSHYRSIKTGFHSLLSSYGWDPSIEFKGAYLFSANSGDTSITVDRRIQLASEVLDLCSAKKNSRISFYYLHSSAVEDHKSAYLKAIGMGLHKALTKARGNRKRDKTVAALHIDNRADITRNEVQAVARPVLEELNYTLLEDVQLIESNYETVGVLLADIVAYLAARIATISTDSELFENLTNEQLETHGKARKLRTSTKLIDKVKKIIWHDIPAA